MTHDRILATKNSRTFKPFCSTSELKDYLFSAMNAGF